MSDISAWGAPVNETSSSWAKVPINGYCLLAAWTVGRTIHDGHLSLEPTDHSGRLVKVEIIDKSGTISRYTVPFSAEDAAEEWDSTADYLSGAGVPSPPTGMTVRLKLPEGINSLDKFMGDLNRLIDLDGLDTSRAHLTYAAFRQAIPKLYSES
nr:DUF5956 family protein [Microbacterium lemovicicum]